ASFPNVTQELDALEAELDRFQSFRDLIDRAHQAEFPEPMGVALIGEQADKTWSAPHPSSKPARDAARAAPLLLQALSRYQVMEQDDTLAALEGGLLGPMQVMQVRRSAYEELLWLADDVMRRRQDHRSGQWLPPLEAARASLVYLGKA